MALALGRSNRLILGLIGAQAMNAAFDTVALYPVARSTKWGRWSKHWAREHLDHLGFPEQLRFLFPVVKTSSALGLAVGLRSRAVGRLTAASIVAYFIIGLGFHVRAKDSATQYVPPVGMLLWSYFVLRAFGSDERCG